MQPITDRADSLQLRNAAEEFFAALKNPVTYSPRRNHEVVIGLIWGLPVPFFALLIHAHAAKMSLGINSLWQIASANPIYIFFFLHPILFAMIFGALGTMRAHREQHIQSLLRLVNVHCDELTRTNTRLKELDRLKSEFLANVTHELKSPLVTALGYTDRILTGHLGEVTDQQRKGLEVSKRNLTRLRNLIDEILDYSRLESGTFRFDFQQTTLNAVIQTAVENAALKLCDRNLTVSIQQPSEPAIVDGDAAKLLQVIINLLDNAIKFSLGGGRIQIKTERVADCWRCSISDQGCGISPENLPLLFERFFQADGSLSRIHDGVGLGLVIAKKIILAHHGRIWVESTVGANSGTTAFIEIPIRKEHIQGACVEIKKEVAHATNSSH